MGYMQNRIIEYGEKPAAQFQAHPNNWRQHPQRQRNALSASLNGVGWVGVVIENKRTGHLLDGHERLWQALQAGDDTPVPYIQVDVSEDEEMLVLATFDPISQMAITDREMLEAIVADLQHSELVQDNDDIDALLAEIAEAVQVPYGTVEAGEAPGAQVDRAEELREKWQTERGQVWDVPSATVAGRAHRVMCGDSTSAEDVARLMQGERAAMLLTDPPYGVGRDKGFGGFGGLGAPIARRQYKDDWDDERPTAEHLNAILQHAKTAIIWGGNFLADILPRSTHWIAWDKMQTMPTFGDCELAWTSVSRQSVKKIEFQYNGLLGKEKERFHPTQKPLGLFVQVIEGYTDISALIIDFFLGSGTTAVAAEQTGRICYGMEISEKYVAVVLERLSGMGLEPRLAETKD